MIYALLLFVFIGGHAFAALRFGYLFIKKKVRALRWLTEARQREREENRESVKIPNSWDGLAIIFLMRLLQLAQPCFATTIMVCEMTDSL